MTTWMMRCSLAAVLLLGAGVATTAAEPAQQQAPPPATAQAEKPALTNLNTADEEALQKLPGIGPATAKAIIEFREQNEGFKKVEELMNVKGIGTKTFETLRPLIKL